MGTVGAADRRDFWIVLGAGLLPIIVANLAFAINVQQGLEACIPYWDGCLSVSRGLRSGPGLVLFKVLALPSAVLMWWAWSVVGARQWPPGAAVAGLRRVVWLGKLGSVFFLVYVLWLGTDGEIYRWLRRYGVVFYFGLTGLAHLMLLAQWARHGAPKPAGKRVYFGVVLLMWAAGIGSAIKRKLIDDPQFLDRVENALEWHFALYLSLCFVALACALPGEKNGLHRDDRLSVDRP